ncbi:hypothetical protein D3C84_473630 [compost metagenome]
MHFQKVSNNRNYYLYCILIALPDFVCRSYLQPGLPSLFRPRYEPELKAKLEVPDQEPQDLLLHWFY